MIDWDNHDGVNVSMINDFMRNQFYENIVKDNVKNKTVLDIGFGTGLLSMLALKHGANKIIAYESNPERYQLGLNIIQDCGLQSKIDLVNKKYTWQDLEHLQVDVAISETVSGDLWQEGMWNSLPRKPGVLFLPSKYFLEIHVKSVPRIFAESIGMKKTDIQFFTPGVDLDDPFIQTVNKHISNWNTTPVIPINKQDIKIGINQFDNRIEGTHGFTPFMRMVTDNTSLKTKFEVDTNATTVNNQPIDFDKKYLTAEVENLDPNQYYIVVPRAGLQHDQYKLYLDTGHWGPTNSAVIVHGLNRLVVSHDVHRGKISYT
jgi:hypothetical protein